ncbi:sugar ABC transporter substrate-binding protein [Ochrobactrum oryzae]|nr:sugar ABC transporter substrate-binding protein [Brucella oryzae]
MFLPFSNKSLDYYFFVIEEEAVKRAVESRKWSFQATNANFDNTKQLEQWQSLMLSQPAGLVADPIDSQAIVSAIRRYNQKRYPSPSLIRLQMVGMSPSPSASTITRAASWPHARLSTG